MNKSRILIFSIAYEPLVGGAELAVRNITDRLSNLGPDGPYFDFDLITARFSRKHKPIERIGNVNVYRVGFGSRVGRYLYPAFAWRLARKLHQRNNYSVVWSIMAAYAGAAALMFLRRYPLVKYLLTLQEGDSVVHIHRQVRGLKKMWQRIFGRADYIQAISHYLAEWAKAEGATCPIEVVPNGVDLSKFSAQGGSASGGKKQNSKVKIITTSRLVEKNGIDILIRAAAHLKSVILNTKFVIRVVGGGKDEKKLKALATDLKVDDVVEFVGEVEPEKIPEYLINADVFVRASRSEGLGSSFLEAMAAGLPVIGTPVGGIPDFLRDGETGLFCKVEDPEDLAKKLKLLIENPPLTQKLSENGKKLVEEKYDWGQVANQMNQIFQKLVA